MIALSVIRLIACGYRPTLIELAGLPPCVELGETNGLSLVPTLRNPPLNGTGVKKYAFSQFPRCNCTYESTTLDTLNGTCVSEYTNLNTGKHQTGPKGAGNNHVCLFTPAAEFHWMGYSIRAELYRYLLRDI